jgi:hypothetical protein
VKVQVDSGGPRNFVSRWDNRLVLSERRMKAANRYMRYLPDRNLKRGDHNDRDD